MLYIIEVPIQANLSNELSQMRVWLDHMRYEPIAFRQVSTKAACRVDFTEETQANGICKGIFRALTQRLCRVSQGDGAIGKMIAGDTDSGIDRGLEEPSCQRAHG